MDALNNPDMFEMVMGYLALVIILGGGFAALGFLLVQGHRDAKKRRASKKSEPSRYGPAWKK